ncbi:MAG: HAD family phosphatase [Ilumatobacter sp.]|uniref:HAD family hydrolase n=1 Tax=Ilumatobacter sp. TaxID=1967498 RepID=UPI0032993119
MVTPCPRAVVFDFGGVLITTIANQIATIADDLDVTPATLHEILLGPRESTPDHPWHLAERGGLPIEEIQSRLAPWARNRGVELRGDEIDRLLAPGGYEIVHAMAERIATLRDDGLATGLLTNTFAEFRPIMERDVDFALFDAVVESFAVGARKPEVAIYEATAEALGVAHSDIVYLDDFDQNLEPARALGWTTIHVTDPTAALRELDEVLSTP